MLLLSLLPAVVLIPGLERILAPYYGSMIASGIGFLLTAMILMVSSFAENRRKGPKEMRSADALVIGALNVLSVFPGVSGIGMTWGAAAICGLNRKFGKTYGILLVFLSTLVLTVRLFLTSRPVESAVAGAGACAAGVCAAAVTGYITLRVIEKRRKIPGCRGFAVLCAAAGIFSIVLSMIRG